MSNLNSADGRRTVMWIIWAGIVGAIVIYQLQFGHGWHAGRDARPALSLPITWVAFLFILGAAMVRWLVIPRVRALNRLLIWMIVGLVLSETVALYGIFLYPADMPASKMTLFVLALLSAVQFVPLYGRTAGGAGGGIR